jgi:hypothetical protein
MATANNTTRLRVEDLERYGKPISDMPKEAFAGQGSIIFAALRRKFGLLGLMPFLWRVLVERRRLRKRYQTQYAELRQRTVKGADEITMLIAMFNVVAQRESREQAYAFVKGIFERVAQQSLPALYQLDQLVRCDGDVFDNFKKFNIAMFEAGDRDFHVQAMEDEPNHLRIVVDRCLNVDAGRMFDCPEIAQLGCDHDLASYPHVEPSVHAIFRRPCTLAKGGHCCDFNFYRAGFAPAGAYENR